ncbi:DNA topoisomerase 3 [bioreactor metagenome]|jgi:DNA topoisomerase-3|uniref:DNA topoisomerase n=1 Tax=bioreactor metagenome TaxID=1076179 RepID=A0A644VZP7_9ZZZZ|nr:DNA topoisomerase 3 [Paludibacter sp.]
MIVCIAEKPSVARDLADILGAKTRKDGYFEGNGYQVTWTFGHLCGLLEPHEYAPEWKSWALSMLPMIPQRFGIKVMDNSGVQKQFSVIKSLVTVADEVVNCGDAGQEGELIQRWVLQKALCKAPVKRLWISSLTEDAIREGFKSLKDEKQYQRLYEAGLSRAIGDWLLGMNATRLYTLKYGRNKQVLSIGRVQTPTLALIVNRHLEIENFKPEKYFELKTVYRDTVFSCSKGKFASEEEGKELLQKIQESDFQVIDIVVKKGTESAPRLFDLTSLQVECNKKFAFSADETLKLIQSLYEKKITTYPRVDTTYLSEDIYPKISGILKGLKDYTTLTESLLTSKLPKTKKVFDNKKVTDHHAIIPTGVAPVNLTTDERKLFDLVAKRFIANFYPECKISTTTVLGEAAELEFKVTGKQILEPGWRVVFEDPNKDVANNKDNADEQESTEESGILPLFEKGERGPHTPGLNEKWTSPPRPYTEATLLRAMETAGKFVDNEELRDAMKENGIGRPSTRAAIIETLFKRDYIRKEKKNLIPTPTGIELIQIIQEDLLKSAELTGIWEKKLREIEKGAFEAGQFLEELKEMLVRIVKNVKTDNRTQEQLIQASVTASFSGDEIVGTVCPLCRKGHILKGNTAYGCSEWKSGCGFRQPFAGI